MKSFIKNLLKDGKFLPINEKDETVRLYKIPRYQRHYDWDIFNVVNLYNDIAEAIEIKKPHYTGSFLLTDDFPIIVIDGQQRMITTFLLLKGFCLQCTSEKIKDEIEKIIFTNPRHQSSDNLRLSVSRQDLDVFSNIMCSKTIDSIQNNGTKMYANFKSGYDFFTELRKDYSDEEIMKYGFESLQICELTIENDIDDEPQKIFRDLNSKGQSLKNSDLIRNFLLMTEESLYDVYWYQIEKMFTVHDEFQSELFEEFIFNYVLMKKPEKINENKIFNAYVSYCEEEGGEFIKNGLFNRELAVKDLFNYASIYKMFLNINVFPDEHTKYGNTINLLKELRDMDQKTPYPFLMRVFYDEKYEKIIDTNTFNEIINLIVVYYVRAIFSKISSGSRRGYLLTMYKNIFENVPDNKNNYYKSVYKYLHENGSGSKMPTRKDFLNAIMTFNLYSNKAVCRHILKVIVNSRYPNEYGEKIKVEKPTIEHLLPQTPTNKWKDEVGGVKKLKEAMEYVDTIGNLSLANHDKNSELGNKSRKEKAEILKKYGEALNVLNKEFIDLKTPFNLDFIKSRAKKLTKILDERFFIDESIETDRIYFDKYDIVFGEINWSEQLVGRDPTYVEIEGASFQTASFYEVGLRLFEYLADHYVDKLSSLVSNSPTYNSHSILLPLEKQETHYSRIGETSICYYVESGGSNFYSACRIAKELGVDLETIRLSLRRIVFDPKVLKFEKVEELNGYSYTEDEKRFLSNNGEIKATAFLRDNKVMVLKGSKMDSETKEYLNDCFVVVRKQLIESGVVNENCEFVTNCLFASPTAASNAILGRNSNGRKEWKTKKEIENNSSKFNRATVSNKIADYIKNRKDVILLTQSEKYIRWTNQTIRNKVGNFGDRTWSGIEDLLAYEINVFDRTKIHLSLYIGPGPQDVRQQWLDFVLRHMPPFITKGTKIHGRWKRVYYFELCDINDFENEEEVISKAIESLSEWFGAVQPKIESLFR